MLSRYLSVFVVAMLLMAGVLGSVLVQGEVTAQGTLVEDEIIF